MVGTLVGAAAVIGTAVGGANAEAKVADGRYNFCVKTQYGSSVDERCNEYRVVGNQLIGPASQHNPGRPRRDVAVDAAGLIRHVAPGARAAVRSHPPITPACTRSRRRCRRIASWAFMIVGIVGLHPSAQAIALRALAGAVP